MQARRTRASKGCTSRGRPLPIRALKRPITPSAEGFAGRARTTCMSPVAARPEQLSTMERQESVKSFDAEQHGEWSVSNVVRSVSPLRVNVVAHVGSNRGSRLTAAACRRSVMARHGYGDRQEMQRRFPGRLPTNWQGRSSPISTSLGRHSGRRQPMIRLSQSSSMS